MDSALRRAQESPLLCVEKRELQCCLELDGAMLLPRTIRVKLKLSIKDIQSSNRTSSDARLLELRKSALDRVGQNDGVRDLAHRFAAFLALTL